MDKIKVILQNNKDFETEVEKYDAKALAKYIAETESSIVEIGNLVVNKHHIECIHKITTV